MKTLRIFSFIGFFRGLYFYLPVFTVFLAGNGISLGVIIFAQAFYSLVQFLAEVPTGVLADRFGHRASMVVGYFVEAMGILVVALFPNAIGLSLCYAIGGLSAAFLSGSEEALFFETAKAESVPYGPAYGAFLSNQTVGMVVATAAGGVAFSYLGVNAGTPLLYATAGMLLLCSLLSLFLRDIHGEKREEVASMRSIFSEGLHLVRSEPLLRTMLAVVMFVVTGEYFLYNIYQPIFEANSVPPVWFGLSISLGLALNAFLVRFVPRLEGRFTLPQIIGGVGFTIAAGYLGLGFVGGPVFSVVLLILILGVMDIHRPVASDYVNERIPSAQRGTVLSLISFAQRVGTLIVRLVLSVAAGYLGAEGSVVVQALYLSAGTLLAVWLLVRCGCAHRVKKPQEAEPRTVSIAG